MDPQLPAGGLHWLQTDLWGASGLQAAYLQQQQQQQLHLPVPDPISLLPPEKAAVLEALRQRQAAQFVARGAPLGLTSEPAVPRHNFQQPLDKVKASVALQQTAASPTTPLSAAQQSLESAAHAAQAFQQTGFRQAKHGRQEHSALHPPPSGHGSFANMGALATMPIGALPMGALPLLFPGGVSRLPAHDFGTAAALDVRPLPPFDKVVRRPRTKAMRRTPGGSVPSHGTVPTLAAAAPAAAEAAIQRRRGRPPGSGKRSQPEPLAQPAANPAAADSGGATSGSPPARDLPAAHAQPQPQLAAQAAPRLAPAAEAAAVSAAAAAPGPVGNAVTAAKARSPSRTHARKSAAPRRACDSVIAHTARAASPSNSSRSNTTAAGALTAVGRRPTRPPARYATSGLAPKVTLWLSHLSVEQRLTLRFKAVTHAAGALDG